MTLDQLRYFQAVCEHGTVSRAAKELHISQPSVSAAIRELEQEYGTPLFHRQARGMVLTEAGECLAHHANGLLAHTRLLNQAMQDMASQELKIRIGFSPTIGTLFLPQIYRDFLRNNPDFAIQIEEHGRDTLQEQLEYGQIDLFFSAVGDFPGDQYSSIPIAKLETLCCVSQFHHLVGSRSVAVANLEKEKLILLKDSHFQANVILQRFAQASLQPDILLRSNQLSTLEKLVSQNIGVGFLFDSVCKSMPGIIGIPFDPPITTTVQVVWKKDLRMTKALHAFLSYIRQFKA